MPAKSMSERFRHWYEHERDSNRQVLEVLAALPESALASPVRQRAVDLFAHLICARRMWLYRLGVLEEDPGGWENPGQSLEDLGRLREETETMWESYLATLGDADLAREFEWQRPDGQRWCWTLEQLLHQVGGHAWYHRGQIMELVRVLGGQTRSTDYIFWARPTQLPR